jgi:predicted alpha/beta-fold hydrolase
MLDTSFDHAVSLVSALAFLLISLVYIPYLCLRWCFSRLKKSDKKKKIAHSLETSSKTTLATTLFLLLAYLLAPLFQQDQNGLHDLLKGKSPKLDEILQKVPRIQKGPSAPLFFHNRHLQFIPWMIQNELHREGIPFQRLELEVTDCIDKTEPGCAPDPLMTDTVTLDIFPPLQEVDSEFNKNFNRSSPIIMYAPGLRSHSQDMPGNMIIRRAYAEGFRSVVMNRRGHTPGMPLKAPRWNLFGDVDDMEQIYWYIKKHLTDPDTAMFLHGISSGTALTVSALRKWDKRRRDSPHLASPLFVASIAITPGYDISKVMQRDRFQFPYNDILTPQVKQHFVLPNEQILRDFDSNAVDATLRANSLQEFLDAAAPFAGYPNATEYYLDGNPINEIRDISTPSFMLNAVDDPCCMIDNLYEQSPYAHHAGKTYAEMITETSNAMVAVTKTGSHCPFLDGFFFPFVRDPLYGGWMLNSWADQVSVDIYRASLEVYGDRR